VLNAESWRLIIVWLEVLVLPAPPHSPSRTEIFLPFVDTPRRYIRGRPRQLARGRAEKKSRRPCWRIGKKSQTFSIFVAAPVNGRSFTCGFVTEVDWKINEAPRAKAQRSSLMFGASMSALLSPVVQEGGIWRVKIVWPNRHVHHFGKFTSERDAIDWITFAARPPL
jgi:hypothetical protein